MTETTHTPLEWYLIAKTLTDIAEIVGKNCPIVPIIETQLARQTGMTIDVLMREQDKRPLDDKSAMVIDFDEKRTGIVRRAHEYNKKKTFEMISK